MCAATAPASDDSVRLVGVHKPEIIYIVSTPAPARCEGKLRILDYSLRFSAVRMEHPLEGTACRRSLGASESCTTEELGISKEGWGRHLLGEAVGRRSGQGLRATEGL